MNIYNKILLTVVGFLGFYTGESEARFDYWVPVLGTGFVAVGYYLYSRGGTQNVSLDIAIDQLEQKIISIEQDAVIGVLAQEFGEYIEKLQRQVVIFQEQGISEEESVVRAYEVVECSLDQLMGKCHAQDSVVILQRLVNLQQILIECDRELESLKVSSETQDRIQELRSRVDQCLVCVNLGLSVLGNILNTVFKKSVC